MRGETRALERLLWGFTVLAAVGAIGIVVGVVYGVAALVRGLM